MRQFWPSLSQVDLDAAILKKKNGSGERPQPMKCLRATIKLLFTGQRDNYEQ